MKWMKWGLGAAGALLAGGALTFAVLGVTGTAQAEEGGGGNASRFQELLAQQLGISLDQLKNAETNARNQYADELAAAGTITADQAAKIKAGDLGDVVRFFAHGGGPGGAAGVRVRVEVNAVEVTAKASGIGVDVVRQELMQGKSLAQIAAEHGVSRDALKNAIAAAQKSALQDQVAKGTLTQLQADKISSELASHIDQIVDRAGGQGAGMNRTRPAQRPMMTR